MPRKPGLNSEFVMFDVVYEDGTQRSNRKVPRALLGGIDGDKPAHGFLIEQDREIAEKSGRPLAKIQTISRSGEKKRVKDYALARVDRLVVPATCAALARRATAGLSPPKHAARRRKAGTPVTAEAAVRSSSVVTTDCRFRWD